MEWYIYGMKAGLAFVGFSMVINLYRLIVMTIRYISRSKSEKENGKDE